MKRVWLFLVIISCAGLVLAQDIILTKAGTTIENVTVVSVTADNVTYKQAKTQKSIASSEVDGILYKDGRYITPPSKQTISVDEVTSSSDAWDMGDVPQQQDYTESVNIIMSGSFPMPEKKTSQRKTSSSTVTKEEKRRQREAEKACFEEAFQAYMSSFEEVKSQALQQGYSKVQANKLAKEEATKMYTQALQKCFLDNPSSNTSNQDF